MRRDKKTQEVRKRKDKEVHTGRMSMSWGNDVNEANWRVFWTGELKN